MAPGPVPVSRDGLGVKGYDNAELLAHALEQVSGDPQLVAGVDAHAGSHLQARKVETKKRKKKKEDLLQYAPNPSKQKQNTTKQNTTKQGTNKMCNAIKSAHIS